MLRLLPRMVRKRRQIQRATGLLEIVQRPVTDLDDALLEWDQ